MIGYLFAGFLLAQSQAVQSPVGADPTPNEWCRGIHMPNSAGGVNLLWTTIRGPEEKLKLVREQMEALGARVYVPDGEKVLPAIRAAYQDNLDIKAIGRLLNEIDAGKFGKLTTEDFAMPLDTLPADKCIRWHP